MANEHPSRVKKAQDAVNQQAAQSEGAKGNFLPNATRAGRRRFKDSEGNTMYGPKGETDHTQRDLVDDVMRMTEEQLAEQDLRDELRRNKQ